MVRVKICGITRERDALAAVKAGADALGFIFAKSPRQVTVGQARKIVRTVRKRALTVGVFVNEKIARMVSTAEICGLDALQLHGNESAKTVRELQKKGYPVIKALRVSDLKKARSIPADLFLFDTAAAGRFGGTGKTFDWKALKRVKLERPWMVSGGLGPRNVKKLLSVLKPYGVDASSGVESSPGKKNVKLVKEFIRHAKSAR